MKDYSVIWRIPNLHKTHKSLCDILDIDEIFAYNYHRPIPSGLRKILYNMKKDSTITYYIPDSCDSLVITALRDTKCPF